MSGTTCAVVAAILPLVLVTVVLERRTTHMKIRRHPMYRRIALLTFTCALIGTAYALIGVELDGYPPAAGFVMWVLAALSLVGLGVILIAALATAEVKEDSKK